jgi:hypothetical protein
MNPTGDDGQWKVPTPDEVSTSERIKRERQRGPVSWVRKLRIRSQVGAKKRVAKPTEIGRPPTSMSAPNAGLPLPPDAGSPDPRTAQLRASADPHQPPESAFIPATTPASLSPPTNPAQVRPSSPAKPTGKQHRPVRINEKARRQRTGRTDVTPPPVAPPSERSLTLGNGFGRCTCGEMFYGRTDVISAAFASHKCGVDRGFDRGDWMFDR